MRLLKYCEMNTNVKVTLDVQWYGEKHLGNKTRAQKREGGVSFPSGFPSCHWTPKHQSSLHSCSLHNLAKLLQRGERFLI